MNLYDLLMKEDTNLREISEILFSKFEMSKKVELSDIDEFNRK